MRTDAVNFAARNEALAKRPRYVIELAFDAASTVLWHFTSHDDAALPSGASAIKGVVEGLSGTSQTLNPDTANATIGSITFSVVDRGRTVTDTLGVQLVLGRSTRRQRVRVYAGFEGLAWADYTLVQTQLVTEIAYDDGVYKFSCADVQREMRKDIFELAKTTLAAVVSADANVIEVFSTAGFAMVAHGSSYSDAPGQTVGYLKIQDEVIRYSNLTPTSFIVAQRGALNTRAVEHTVDSSASTDRRTAVEEYVYLELPAVDLMYRLLTGRDRLGNAVMPAAWHLGIPTSYVRLANFTGIGADLWNTTSDAQGFIVRFAGLEKTDGKKFIEAELALLAGLFMPVYADGALGLRRMSNILAGATYVKQLDGSNLVDWGELRHDFNALHNAVQITWNFEPLQGDFTRVNLLLDSDSIARHGRANPLKLKFRGLHGSRHTASILAQRFDALRDRFTNPPLRLPVTVLPSLNTLEVGDVVRARPPGVRDFVANGDLDRSFEIQNVTIDWVSGVVGLQLFASSQAPGEIAATAEATVLANNWYTSAGAALSSAVTITGSNPGHVTAGGTLTGVAGDLNAAGSIFYYDGDLVIDQGVTINVVNGVQLRVKGFLQNNGFINGKGNGLAGAAALGIDDAARQNPGTAGFIGVTEAGGGLTDLAGQFDIIASTRAEPVVGANAVMPAFNLAWDGSSLTGLPSDLRGSSGSSGVYWKIELVSSYPGGAGGAGGAGLIIVSRGFAQGAAGVIDLSGNDGLAVAPVIFEGGVRPLFTPQPGSGAGGAPGGLLVLLDGAIATVTGLTDAGFVALQGKTPIPANNQITAPVQVAGSGLAYSYFVGTGDGSTFPRPNLSNSRGGSRVQYVPNNTAPGAAVSDLLVTLRSPTNLGLASGTAQLLRQGDGTLVTRVLVTWTPSLDQRTAGYEVQFKPSSETTWSTVPIVFGQNVAAAYITGAVDGMNYDVRLRAVGDLRLVSDWVTIASYIVVGKTEPPSDVTGFTIEGTRLSWVAVPDGDVIGYRIRYQPGTSQSWGDGIPLFDGAQSNSPFEMLVVPTGPVTFMIKAVDSSGNESQNVAVIVTSLGDALVANVVETFDRKAAGFPGTKTACTVSAGNLVADSITPLMWKPDDSVSMWNVDPSVLMWATVQYAVMTYVEDGIVINSALAGSRMTIQNIIVGDPWSIEYRENSQKLMWSFDTSTLMWNADSGTLMWDQPQWLPWPGEIVLSNYSVYDFRIKAGQANTQGIVSEFTLTVDAPDLSETLNNVVIASGGTRLPITLDYAVIKNVQLTVQADGGSAISARVSDKNIALGPLVFGLDAAGSNTSALIDAHVQGY